jgi:predicted NBD/HSP70 family sugar kinase
MQSLGINIGSTCLKMALYESNNTLESSKILWSASVPHEGDFGAAVHRLFREGKIPVGIPSMVTGNEGRFMFSVS